MGSVTYQMSPFFNVHLNHHISLSQPHVYIKKNYQHPNTNIPKKALLHLPKDRNETKLHPSTKTTKNLSKKSHHSPKINTNKISSKSFMFLNRLGFFHPKPRPLDVPKSSIQSVFGSLGRAKWAMCRCCSTALVLRTSGFRLWSTWELRPRETLEDGIPTTCEFQWLIPSGKLI